MFVQFSSVFLVLVYIYASSGKVVSKIVLIVFCLQWQQAIYQACSQRNSMSPMLSKGA